MKKIILCSLLILSIISKGNTAVLLTKQNTNELLSKALQGDKPVVIKFYADWCVPCQRLAPMMEEVEKKLANKAIFFKVNTDENRDFAVSKNIGLLPTILILKNHGDKELFLVGAPRSEKDLEEILRAKLND